MDKLLKKALQSHLNDLNEYQDMLFDKGHTFWHCDAQDQSHNKPFYYYQINRSLGMSTCSTCWKLMENRKKIRAIEKQLGLPLTPLTSNVRETTHNIRVSVSSASIFNPTNDYMKAHSGF